MDAYDAVLQEPVKDVFNYSQNVHIRACDFVADGFQRMQASDPYEALAEKMVNCIYNGSVKQRIRRAQELASLTEADGGILCALGLQGNYRSFQPDQKFSGKRRTSNHGPGR